jgi:hypothetical protein
MALEGHAHQLGSARDHQLGEEVPQVILDGRQADHELVRNLVIVQASYYQG